MTRENAQNFTIFPIGIVKTSKKGNSKEIHIFEKFEAGLEGIERHLNLIIFYWMHRMEKRREILQFRPCHKGMHAEDKIGIFATRAPFHPNPIGLIVVGLMERNSNILKVKGLDAIDDTPVIDIKPYFLA